MASLTWIGAFCVFLLLSGLASAQKGSEQIRGQGISSLLLVNQDTSDRATIIGDLYHQIHGGPVTITGPGVYPGKTRPLYLPAETALQSGVYAAHMASNLNIGFWTPSSWHSIAGSSMAGQEHALASKDLIIPYAASKWRSQTSIISVLNTDVDAPASVTVEFYDSMGLRQAQRQRMIAAGRSITFVPGELGVGDAIHGNIRLWSNTEIAAGVHLAMEPWFTGVAGYQGLPVEFMTEELFAPDVSAGVTLGLTNPGDAALGVDVIYRRNMDASGDACPFGAEGLSHFGVGRSAALPSRGGFKLHVADVLPEGCFASATVKATGPIAGAVVAWTPVEGQASAYNLSAPDEAGTDLVLPIYRHRQSTLDITTLIHAMNLSPVTATLELEVWLSPDDRTPACGGCRIQLPPLASYRWDPSQVAGLRDEVNVQGTARLTSDGPILAVVADTIRSGDVSRYRGLAMCTDVDGPAPRYCGRTRYAPWASKERLDGTYPLRKVLLPAVFAP